MTGFVARVPVDLFATFTDFGADGPYIGQVHAVLAAGAPDVPRLDLLTNAPAFDPRASAYLLAALAPRLPERSLVLAVVDPGVGGDRAAVVVEFDGRIGVGPDNGLFVPLLRRSGDACVKRVIWKPEVLSKSFHARDWFAPLALKLAKGLSVETADFDIESLVGAEWAEDLAEIVYVDAYGNAMIGLRSESVPEGAVVAIGDQRVRHAPVFDSVEKGQSFWYTNSCGLVELAVNCGRADQVLGAQVGTPVTVENG